MLKLLYNYYTVSLLSLLDAFSHSEEKRVK